VNEQFEMVGVIGTEKFPVFNQVWDGRQVHHSHSNERIVPMMFKDLPPGTELFIKKVEQ
jgi:xanthosine utilization system XapX-like protein